MIPINFMPFFTDQWPYIVGGIFLYAIIFISLDKTRENIRCGKDSTDSEKPAHRRHKCRDLKTFLEEWQEFQDDDSAQDLEDQEMEDDSLTQARTNTTDNVRKTKLSLKRSEDFLEVLRQRHPVKSFSPDPVPMATLENIIACAGHGPSSHGKQPWTFVVVTDEKLKKVLQRILEPPKLIEEVESLTEEVDTRAKLRAKISKSYLSQAPVLLVLMRQEYSLDAHGAKEANHFNDVSCSLAAGFLLSGLEYAGLATKIVVPTFGHVAIGQALGRPESETALFVFPIGFPQTYDKILETRKIHRKPLTDIMCVASYEGKD
ncbi:hypothetical protein TCAL_03360 [Tigriopus californicus]|uniref:Nitroreductase domain-containing protein n=1 Tax=Tigriopus californicus TaxID=6832 RepID=A0A553P7N0_TIGCA|nr:iodotyrosine deiodinase-like [Tigriopus californicus]TRY73694.1 hypothetical protein TCAL_03360 [Tigriopus californicus]